MDLEYFSHSKLNLRVTRLTSASGDRRICKFIQTSLLFLELSFRFEYLSEKSSSLAGGRVSSFSHIHLLFIAILKNREFTAKDMPMPMPETHIFLDPMRL